MGPGFRDGGGYYLLPSPRAQKTSQNEPAWRWSKLENLETSRKYHPKIPSKQEFWLLEVCIIWNSVGVSVPHSPCSGTCSGPQPRPHDVVPRIREDPGEVLEERSRILSTQPGGRSNSGDVVLPENAVAWIIRSLEWKPMKIIEVSWCFMAGETLAFVDILDHIMYLVLCCTWFPSYT